jgi:hypothetical protein
MTDDEMDLWRRQWQSQPTIPIDLIRRVERQTVYMRLNWISQIVPGLIGVGTIIAAVVEQTLPWVLLAVGTWLFIIIAWRFTAENLRGVWAPAAETTAAYLELSIERCRRQLASFRFSSALTVLLTTFILIVDYQILASAGALTTTDSILIFSGMCLLAATGVVIILVVQRVKYRRTEAELNYLLDLQRLLRT